ncbi:Alpha/Beta hydrolase protein [Tribonema minus]|uniref:Alpha/Beta hydrolase protein n=1 Tax=Tribonema minus TaxID=303371 RepID=A0A835Z5S8_9STRA|nr:Alpha/Beta hydrolase protein [Tribonema minus]
MAMPLGFKISAAVILLLTLLVNIRKPSDLAVGAWIPAEIVSFLWWATGVTKLDSLDADAIVAVQQRVAALTPRGAAVHVDAVTHMTVPSGDGYDIPAVLYHPNSTARALNEQLMVTVYLHGGGWVLGSAASVDAVARALAVQTNGLVLSVDYRMAPRHPFPTPVDDGVAVVRWALKHAASVGGDPRRVAVAGDSAGGNLGAAVALSLAGPRLLVEAGAWRSPLCAAVLVSPPLSHAYAARNAGSHARYAHRYLLLRRVMVAMWSVYLAGPRPDPERVAVTGRDWRASPLEAPAWRLRALPPTLLPYAAAEILADEIEDFAAAAAATGARGVALRRYERTVHGFFTSGAPEARECVTFAAGFLRDHCAR